MHVCARVCMCVCMYLGGEARGQHLEPFPVTPQLTLFEESSLTTLGTGCLANRAQAPAPGSLPQVQTLQVRIYVPSHLCPVHTNVPCTPMSRAHLCPVHILKTLTQDLLLVLHALPTHLPPRPPIFKEKKQEKYYLHVREDNSVHNFKHFQFKSKQKVTALLRSDSQAISPPFPPHVKCISKWISEYPQLCN